MKAREVRIHAYPSASGSARGALLFVHGAYVNSTCWEFNFAPFFQNQGYDCFAVDLSGHGASAGRERIDDFGIDHYAEDVAAALRAIGRPAILVGHSMGARVLERFLETGDAPGVVFLAPVPTTGTVGSALQLSLRHPSFFQALDDAVNGKVSDEVGELMTRIYFAPGMSLRETQRYLPMLGPESQRAVAEMAMLQVRRAKGRRRLPALVIGGENDAVFSPSMLHFFALPWEANVHRIQGAGHMLMLDPQWQVVAERMLAWMAAKEGAEIA